ncbi:Mss4-like protein [Tribonema minus]|uniref:Peptide methionine sulfoxide reductase B1, chloroplastic n=1 Tax=Tribonema minus TaxID=303371 RepID=A0A835ZI62_9STRA|nr:Mss4-like protein [Tribonema minus]
MAGARPQSVDKAKELFVGSSGVDVVEYDLSDEKALQRAIEGCSTVVCALGALENEVLNPFGPYTVDGRYTQNLINAAKATPSVKHMILVTSLGTAKFGMPAGILNLFWGVLKWKHQSELLLAGSGLPYTIIRPGGMERPTDEYELTHNVRLARQDTFFGGQVSRLQVAKLVAVAAAQPEIAAGKTVEVVAETDAPKRDYADLLREFTPSKSDAEWKQELSPLAYHVLREEGTERPWTSPLNEEKREGVFKCAGCGQALFASGAKFNSGTGWPSFFEPVDGKAVNKLVDMKLGMPRTEVRCSSCDGHLGHLFDDGPRPTGQRFCMNGAALSFDPSESAAADQKGGSSEAAVSKGA